jgi:DNA-binding NarL/FixJ family response regulator
MFAKLSSAGPAGGRKIARPTIAAALTERHDAPRVLVVDDHDLFRRGLCALLEELGANVVGEAENGARAVKLVQELSAEVVLMDLNMPALNGVDATREIMRIAPLTRIVVLTVSDRDDDVIEAIVAGACGYLLKDSAVTDVVRAIDAAAAGESLVSPYIASKLLQRLRATFPDPGVDPSSHASLSPRELEVLRLVASGKDNGGIARELSISPKTVKNHVSSILVKLQLENRIQAAVYAVRSGIA